MFHCLNLCNKFMHLLHFSFNYLLKLLGMDVSSGSDSTVRIHGPSLISRVTEHKQTVEPQTKPFNHLVEGTWNRKLRPLLFRSLCYEIRYDYYVLSTHTLWAQFFFFIFIRRGKINKIYNTHKIYTSFGAISWTWYD